MASRKTTLADGTTELNIPGWTGGSSTGTDNRYILDDLTIKYNNGKYPNIVDAVKSGIGPTAFAEGELMKRFGTLNLEEANRNDVEKIKKELGLDDAKKAVEELRLKAPNVVPTLQESIRQQDKYLTLINNMLDTARNSLMGQGMDDPASKLRVETYIKYLEELQTRQTKRYSDVVNTASAKYTTELAQKENDYRDLVAQANDRINSAAAINTAEYNSIVARAVDQYNWYDQAPIREFNTAQLKANMNALQNGGGKAIDWTKALPFLKDSVLSETDNLIDKNGAKVTVLRPSNQADLVRAYYNVAQNPDWGPQAVSETILRGLEGSMGNVEPTDNTKKVEVANDIKNSLLKVAMDPNTNSFAYDTVPQLIEKVGEANAGYASEKISSLRKALKDLIKMGINDANKAKWINANKASINENVLKGLYSAIDALGAKEPGKVFEETKGNIDLLSDSALAEKIAQKLQYNWVSTFQPYMPDIEKYLIS